MRDATRQNSYRLADRNRGCDLTGVFTFYPLDAPGLCPSSLAHLQSSAFFVTMARTKGKTKASANSSAACRCLIQYQPVCSSLTSSQPRDSPPPSLSRLLVEASPGSANWPKRSRSLALTVSKRSLQLALAHVQVLFAESTYPICRITPVWAAASRSYLTRVGRHLLRTLARLWTTRHLLLVP